MPILTLSDVNVHNKRVLVREDFNVPMENGKITNDKRLQAALPTIKQLLDKQAAIILLSHLGRPAEGTWEEKYSLEPVAHYLSKVLQKHVRFEKHYLDGIAVQPGEIVLCENVRFNSGEKANSPLLAAKMAKLGDIFIMDAFATAHRAEASTCGIIHYAKEAVAGPLMESELNALGQVMENPERPLTAIIGGAKVSDKLILLNHLVTKVDTLIVGGGIANTFLAALGFQIGKSLHEPELVLEAKKIWALAEKSKCFIPIPQDVVVAPKLDEAAPITIKELNTIEPEDRIFDIGPMTIRNFSHHIQKSATILWNGPVGVFEYQAFEAGTRGIAEAVAHSQAFSVAGGGDTLSAIERFGVTSQISYLSTGGGAFLEYIEGRKMPAIEALKVRYPQG